VAALAVKAPKVVEGLGCLVKLLHVVEVVLIGTANLPFVTIFEGPLERFYLVGCHAYHLLRVDWGCVRAWAPRFERRNSLEAGLFQHVTEQHAEILSTISVMNN